MSATAGKAVLEVVQRENLLANVKRSGEHLLAGLRQLAARHEIIGDVRGKGLFLAVELVKDRATKEPAADAAAAVLELMRQAGVLIACIGKHHNTLKMDLFLRIAPEL